ncbi:alanine/glycine:cation symporter family protein [Pseudomonas hefeiensis]|uniref:Alanine/glycine:cation symporter family protein n=1 Tax=Pseudomonas hefeiensis TaxID=2738125 RepID=A0ABY9G9K1_9PSED|nr:MULTISPECIES: alanine/glycine:cation symporter family protein [unclassified Pseudomonas]WLH12284.1 alanine/glycine:cation symporter family protein [Pseudomonas sp. FP205]WLH95337.1 alanine/glycine:cation symporter family protein [Pseudomonas sp. FP53]WLI39623.1 alanine/glycine:cation symporter family protein [Pseudomonas sp. FP821]
MEFLQTLFGYVDSLTWGWSLIPILVVFGVFITIMSGFVQFEFFGRMFRVLSGKNQNSDPNNLSARQALLVSVGGRVGGGNIAGVAVAITLGGPGAVFWMWCIALIGMATSLVECTLAQIYKRTDGEHSFRGGPADYIRHGLGSNYNWLAIVYAICLLAAFGLGFNAFQGNTVAGAMQDSFGISRFVTGALLVLVTGFVIFGGIKRIAKAADVVVPVMALGYLALALIVIVMNIGEIPALFVRIVSSAFGYEEAIAGGMGAAIAQGLRRGLFSNEAGLGSAPNVAATALVHHPVSQGITQSFSVFIDTIVICSCTAFIILLGDVYVAGATGIDGVVLTQQSLASHFGEWSRYALSLAILLFAFSSIIYNVYLGENALAAITKSKPALLVLRVLILGLIFLGAAAPNATSVFFFSDPMMGILALVNLIAILMLFPTAIRVINDFRAQLKAGVARPVFDPAKFPDLDLDRKAWDTNRWK